MRGALRTKLAKAKRLPKDMRAKKTKALRQALTKDQTNRLTLRGAKQRGAFPKRKYATLLK